MKRPGHKKANQLGTCIVSPHSQPFQHFTVSCANGVVLEINEPLIMGIVNVTPDSFSDGGLFMDPGIAVEHALQMVSVGAAIIDVGGESTRPGSEGVSAAEELRRVLPVIDGIREITEIPISIDTTKAEVAEKAIAAGANIINDVSALSRDPGVAEVAASTGAAVCLMHMKGTPDNMQVDPQYDGVVAEVKSYLADSIERAVSAGISRNATLVDPGIGFGKTLNHNLALMGSMRELLELGRPVLVGPSRKSWLGTLVERPVDERLAGTIAAVALLAADGASILRVHDVVAAVDAVKTARAIRALQAPGNGS